MPQDFLWDPLAGGPAAARFAAAWIDGRPGISTVWELGLYVLGTVGTAAGGVGIVWRVARPHVMGWMDHRIQAVTHQLEQVGTSVERVEQQVASPPGSTLESNHLELSAALADVRQQLARLHRRLDAQADAHTHTHQVLEAHVEQSLDYLHRASELLGAQGVQLPQPGRQPRESQ